MTKNSHPTTPEPGSFAELFLQRLDKMGADMAELGMDMSELCREAGIARGTPDRWRKVIPKTVELVTVMEDVIAQRRKDLAEKGIIPKAE